MNYKKKILITVISIFLIAGIVVTAILVANENKKRLEKENQRRIEQIKNNKEEWKNNAVITPKAGLLQAAGYITIEWNSADKLGKVKGYKVYVNDKLIKETDEKTTTCEYYSTDVSKHTVYIEADLEQDSVIYSDVITFYVNKKGLCMNRDMAMAVEANQWGVSWYYNWAFEAFKYDSFSELQYVPMLWNSGDGDGDLVDMFQYQGYKYLLMFNEPDLEEQANMTIDEAIEGMKLVADKDMILGSPATALMPPWSDEWFQPFMKRMEKENMDVDFIPIHHYWNWWNEEGVQAFLDLIDETWEMYHKPIWITEFALTGDPGKNKQQIQSVKDYMAGVIKGLDERPYVERYAWFSFSHRDMRHGGSSLMDHYTGEIFEVGKLYQKLGLPEGYGDDSIPVVEKNKKEDIIK